MPRKHYRKALLNSKLPATQFKETLEFAIFGLGDSNYEKFNAAARKLKARLVQLGASEICALGAGDEATGAQEVSFTSWINEKLLVSLNLASIQPFPVELDPIKYACNAVVMGDDNNVSFSPPPPPLHHLRVKKNVLVTSPDWFQEVRHLEFSILPSSEKFTHYFAGDVALFKHSNAKLLGGELELTKFITRKITFASSFSYFTSSSLDFANLKVNVYDKTKGNAVIIQQKSILEIFDTYFDLLTFPRQDFFEQASFYCTDKEESEKMLEISQDSGLYCSYCKNEHRTFVEVLDDFQSCRIDFLRFFQLCPVIKPRQYSISSSSLVHSGELHVCVAVLKYLTRYKRVKVGNCSKWLSVLSENEIISFDGVASNIISEAFRSYKEAVNNNNDEKTNKLILIGPGTGVAPMRSILLERENTSNDAMLYFGCRHPQGDFLYRAELEKKPYVKIAFSRLEEGKKIYVQHLINRDGEMISDWIVNQAAWIFISGSAKRMPQDVKETLIQVLMRVRGLKREEATAILKQMEKKKRLVVEAYS